MSNYRVVELNGKYEPQHYYFIKGGEQWIPLDKEGCWIDPNVYNTGEIKVRSPMEEWEANRSILRAQAINQENIKSLPSINATRTEGE